MASPRRLLDVTDPIALRALAHPLRLRLLDLVREHRPVTAADLARLLDESTASVSYHLSVLGKHGFIERDPVPGETRRHKPWRTTFDAMRITGHGTGDGPGRPPVETPEGAVLSALLAQTRAQQDAYLSGDPRLTPDWQEVGAFQLTRLVLTPEEVDRMAEEVQVVLDRYSGRDGRDLSSPDLSRVSVSFVAVPVAEEGGAS